MPDWSTILPKVSAAGAAIDISGTPTPVSGGDISAAWRIGDVFLKTGLAGASDMFVAEAAGLEEIAATQTVRVPRVILTGCESGDAFLALEWLSLQPPDAAIESALGQQLADMHRVTQTTFGWYRDNTIGLTAQRNDASNDWVEFFRSHRLGFQLRLALQNGFTGELQEQGARLMKRLPVFFDTAEIRPSLLHGDLWGGNWAASDGVPVIFDPAVYYGDRESDLAMTKLFGGFGSAFYAAYESSWPLPPGHREREVLYQLYHVLNHLNLFGSAYLSRAIGLINRLV